MARLDRKHAAARLFRSIFFPAEEVKLKENIISRSVKDKLNPKPSDTVTFVRPNDYR